LVFAVCSYLNVGSQQAKKLFVEMDYVLEFILPKEESKKKNITDDDGRGWCNQRHQLLGDE